MKANTLLFCLIVVSSALAQKNDSVSNPSQNETQYNYYMGRSKSANTTGGILIATGGLLMIIGVSEMNQSSDDFLTGMYHSMNGVGLAVFGGAVMITSIPFFARGAKFKRDAQLLFGVNSIRLPASGNLTSISQLTLTFRF